MKKIKCTDGRVVFEGKISILVLKRYGRRELYNAQCEIYRRIIKVKKIKNGYVQVVFQKS